jgi:hypothetical protein
MAQRVKMPPVRLSESDTSILQQVVERRLPKLEAEISKKITRAKVRLRTTPQSAILLIECQTRDQDTPEAWLILGKDSPTCAEMLSEVLKSIPSITSDADEVYEYPVYCVKDHLEISRASAL